MTDIPSMRAASCKCFRFFHVFPETILSVKNSRLELLFLRGLSFVCEGPKAEEDGGRRRQAKLGYAPQSN